MLELSELFSGDPRPSTTRSIYCTKHQSIMVRTGRDHLFHKEREIEEKGRVEERRVKKIAAQKAARMQSARGGSRAGANGGSRVGKSTGGEGGGLGEAGSQHSELEPANIDK